MIQQVAVNRYSLTASLARESFFDFVQQFWEVLIPEQAVWNWHIEFICQELQDALERVFRGEKKLYDLICNISPGTTKSTIASVMLTPWAWTRFPSLRYIGGSYTFPLALELSRKSRDIVMSEKYQRCFPDIQLKSDQNTKSLWANTKGGMRYACTVGGSVTGMHAHVIGIDDPLDPKGARSDQDILTANEWMSETVPSRKVDKEIAFTFLIMQRLHQNDPTGYLLKKAKKAKNKVYREICLPAKLSSKVKPVELRKKYKGGLMDPVRLSQRILDEAESDLGQFGFAGQFGQDPVPLGGGMFQTDKLIYAQPGQLRHFKQLVRFWDKAGTTDAGAYTVGALMGEDQNGQFWILDIIRFQKEASTRERIIKQTAEMDGYQVRIGVEQEPGSGGKESAESTVRNLRGFRCFVQRPTGAKEERADPLSVQVNSGNVYVKEGAGWILDLIEEMRYFPFSTYKDQIDALSGGFNEMYKKKKSFSSF